jgi:predicted 3-demethylubiquinone-9 3-methyltransferase (glyoxalase superfamily)
MQKITPFLWFDDKAEEAMNFYVSVFKNSKVGTVTRYGEAGPGPKGTVMSATFQLDGQEFFALNGGPLFKFTEAISFFVNCETQQEVDELWGKLSEGGKKTDADWSKDKYGLSWQIILSVLTKMLRDENPGKAKKVMEAMLQMTKIDIGRLRRAYGRGLLRQLDGEICNPSINSRTTVVSNTNKQKETGNHGNKTHARTSATPNAGF